jgi:hypothetical protein
LSATDRSVSAQKKTFHPLAFVTFSVNRLGEISPFGRNVLALGAFFSVIYRLNDLGRNFFPKNRQKSPKIHLNKL